MPTVQRAYKYRFYPTPEQEQLLAQTFGCTRFVYNWALNLRSQAYERDQTRINYHQTSAALSELKKDSEHRWLNEVSSVPLQQVLRHLQTGFVNFFKGWAKYLMFKKKHQRQSAEFTRSGFKWDGQHVWLAKCKQPLIIRWSRECPSNLSTVTVSRDDDGWTSGAPKYTRQYEQQLAKAQRRLAKKKLGSRNRLKVKRKVAKIHAKIADSRRDFTHKLTTNLINENQVISIESLRVKNMVKNRKLAKSISDSNWGELVRQLKYKAQ